VEERTNCRYAQIARDRNRTHESGPVEVRLISAAEKPTRKQEPQGQCQPPHDIESAPFQADELPSRPGKGSADSSEENQACDAPPQRRMPPESFVGKGIGSDQEEKTGGATTSWRAV
jgi:hypothetical protein